MKSRKKFSGMIVLGLCAAVLMLVTGCALFDRRQTHRANSLYAYLYSDQAEHIDRQTVPVLSLPLRVGVAFVPQEGSSHREDLDFSSAQQMKLMQEISAEFKSYPFIKSIELIPTDYLAPHGGFANLDQIRNIYGVDVMVLLSYDQVQFTDEGVLSLTYWTVVGAYIVPGEKNETRTLLDAAAYDIASRKLLFRAPGVGATKGSATPINLNKQLRAESQQGFQEAATNLVVNLKTQLELFKERVKNAPPDEIQVVHKPGYTGGNALSGTETVLAAGMGGGAWWLRRKRRP